jgi:Tol biopolymer transport system component
LGSGDLRLPAESTYSHPLIFPFFWLPGGEALTFWKHPYGENYQLVRWTPDQPLVTVLETPAEPLMSRGRYLTNSLAYQENQDFLTLDRGKPVVQDRIAIYTGPHQVTLVRPDGTGAEVLIPDSHEVLRLGWASDGRAIGGVWTAQEAGGRHVYLSWSGPTRNSVLELESDISAVNYLEWAPEDVDLVLTVERPSGETVIMVDPVTGTRTTLLDEMEDAFVPTFYDQDGFFTLLWQSKTGQSGYDGYHQDGSRDFRVNLPFRTYDRIFFSPDHQWAAPKGWVQNSGEHLALVRTDGSAPRVLLSGLGGLGHPVWSPDSRMVAFTHWTKETGLKLDIVSIDGETLWSTPYPYSEKSTVLTWQKCP